MHHPILTPYEQNEVGVELSTSRNPILVGGKPLTLDWDAMPDTVWAYFPHIYGRV